MNNNSVYMQPKTDGLNQQQNYIPDTYSQFPDSYQAIQPPDYNYQPLPSQKYLPQQMPIIDNMPIPHYPVMLDNNMYNEREMNYDDIYDFSSMTAILERYIGRVVKAEFIAGGKIEERVGRLTSVGSNYIVLSAISENVLIICDRKTLKFLTVILNDDTPSF